MSLSRREAMNNVETVCVVDRSGLLVRGPSLQ
jgi:hypothetical protein